MKSFSRTVSGVCTEGITLALLVVIVGCATSSGPATPGAASTTAAPSTAQLSPDGATNVYVSQSSPSYGSVLQFKATSNGTASPNSTVTTQAANPLKYGLAVDPSGSIYVGALALSPNGNGAEVLVYPAGSSATASPTRTILGGTASFTDPQYMAVDSSGQLYVLDPSGSASANDGGVYVFASTAKGATTPVRHLQGSLTQLATSELPNAISVDAVGNIYVLLTPTTVDIASWTILVFSATQNGNVAPARVITVTPVTLPLLLVAASAYALDASGDLYVAYVGTEGEAITEFASNGSTTATPVKTISGSATGLSSVFALRVDAAGNIFTLSTGSSGVSVDAFGASGSGNLAPAVQFTSTSLNLVAFAQLAVN